MDFITIGEMVIDFLPGQEEGSYIRNAGGAPANVAIAAARNGLKAGMYCKVGNDDFGRFLIKILEDNHVTPLAPGLCDDAITTMAFVSLSESNERSFTFARKPGADMMLDKTEIVEEELQSCRLLQAGSCTLSAGKSVEATEYAMKQAHESGTMVGFDINYRNLMWNDDKQACTDKVLTVLPYVDFLKLSDEEADMVGGRDNIPMIMKDMNISVVVLTLGKDGCELFYEGESWIMPGFQAPVVADTTGAGDAFWGSFLSEVLNQGVNHVNELTVNILKRAIDYGNAGGSLAVRAKGAIASLPTKAQIEQFLQENKGKGD